MSLSESPRKLRVDADLIKSFTDGELSQVVEDKVAAYLDQRPKLVEQAVALSGENFLARLRDVRQRSLPPVNSASNKALVAAVEIVEPADSNKLSDQKGIPAELANYPAYKITKELGRGGMGVVYLAKNIQMDRLEVLKVLNERLLDHEGAKERFLREVRAVSKLSHPNIVTSYSILPLDSILVFVMEFVNGTDLHKYIHARHPLPVGQACSFATQIATGLQHALERGLVHRDIKPANVIVYKSDGRMQLKILDFGLAKATSEKNIGGLTQDGTMLGTPEYMSPEQTLNAAKADIRADIYSLGCTLYCMLTGHPPFRGTHGEVLMAHAQCDPQSVNLLRPDVPSELAAVVDRMMAKVVAKRYQTPNDVIAALRPFIDETSAPNRRGGEPRAAAGTLNDLAASDRETSVEAAVPSLSLDTASRLDNSASQLTAIAGLMGDQRRGVRQVVRRSQRLRARPKKIWPVWIKPASFVGILLLLLGGLWAGGVFRFRTLDGTIVVEQLPEGAEIVVDGLDPNKLHITWNEGKDRAEIEIAPGQYKVDVLVRGTIRVKGKSVSVDAGKQSSLVVSFEDAQPPFDQVESGNHEESVNGLSPLMLIGKWIVNVDGWSATYTFNTDGTAALSDAKFKDGRDDPRSIASGKWMIDLENSRVLINWDNGCTDALNAPIDAKLTNCTTVIHPKGIVEFTAVKIRSSLEAELSTQPPHTENESLPEQKPSSADLIAWRDSFVGRWRGLYSTKRPANDTFLPILELFADNANAEMLHVSANSPWQAQVNLSTSAAKQSAEGEGKWDDNNNPDDPWQGQPFRLTLVRVGRCLHMHMVVESGRTAPSHVDGIYINESDPDTDISTVSLPAGFAAGVEYRGSKTFHDSVQEPGRSFAFVLKIEEVTKNAFRGYVQQADSISVPVVGFVDGARICWREDGFDESWYEGSLASAKLTADFEGVTRKENHQVSGALVLDAYVAAADSSHIVATETESLAVPSTATEIREITATPASPDWQMLFNGRNLSGWQGSPVHWFAKDECITGMTTPSNALAANTCLIWQGGDVEDFEVEFEYRISSGGNSGLQYRSTLSDPSQFIMSGYQADIDGSLKFSGSNYEEKGRGMLAERGQRVTIDLSGGKRAETIADPTVLAKALNANDWNHCRVVAIGNKLSQYLNSQLMSEVIDGDSTKAARKGLIGFQLHRGEPMQVQFRNVRLKKLTTAQSPESVAESKTVGDIDPFKVGSVWTYKGRTLTVLSRTSDRFIARFEIGSKIVREVTGPIVGNKLQWLAKDVNAIKSGQGDDNFGTISTDEHGSKIDFVYRDSSGRDLGNFALTLQKPQTLSSQPPADAEQFSDKFYKAFNENLTWHQAQARCEAMGGVLAIVPSQQTNSFLMGLAERADLTSAWLGASDETKEGEWIWTNASRMSYNNWGKGQPNNKLTGEHYLLLIVKHQNTSLQGTWSDQPDQSTQHQPGFICLWDSNDGLEKLDGASANTESQFFNGKDLSGWLGLPRFWTVKDGAIIGSTLPNGIPEPTYLVSDKDYQDFELRCKVMLVGQVADSGIMFRSVVVKPSTFGMHGPQLNLTHGAWGDVMFQGHNESPDKSGRFAALKADDNAVKELLSKDGVNEVFLRCVGNLVTVRLNGKEILNKDISNLPRTGRIGWQLWTSGPYEIKITNVQFIEL